METRFSLIDFCNSIKTVFKTAATRLLLILALSPALCALSQVQQGFNYQAVARDPATGYSITGAPMKVQLTIQTDSLPGPGTIIWQETHNVTTNNYGIFNVIIGKGIRVGGAASFSQVDWTAWPKYFIRNEIEYPLGSPPYKLLGVSRLWSVPFALVAGEFDGPVKKLAVKGETTSTEEALFEVKNKDGQTVFAVYNEGVRVYVSDGEKAPKGGFSVGGFGTDKAGESTKYLFVDKDSVRIYLDTNPLTKKPRGGFSVGGFDLTKGVPVQNYLDVSSDSVRIYIDTDPATKKLKGGFAVGGYDMTKGPINKNFMRVTTDSTRVYVSDVTRAGSLGGFAVKPVSAPSAKTDFFNVTNAATAEVVKNEPRVMWYSKKSALIGGEVHVGSPDSVGLNSTALGYRSIAKGNQSQAFGYRSVAYGTYSTAIGYKAESNTNGMAVGYLAKASGSDAFALGSGAIASANKSFAFGSVGIDSLMNVTGNTKATGDYAYAFGLGSIASGIGAFAMGANDTASGNFSTSMGYKTKADGWYATAMGGYSKATKSYASAFGFKSKASAIASFASGYYTEASGDQSASMGYKTKAIGSNSAAFGNSTQAQGSFSFAANNTTTSVGNGASSFGGNTNAGGQYSMATGQLTSASGWYSFAGGDGSTSSGTASFAIGKSNSSAGYYSVATGIGNTAKSYACFTIGSYCNDPGTNATNYSASDPLFIAGNGYLPLKPSQNALILYKNGNMTIAGTLTAPSDLRLKNVISDLGSVLPQVNKIVPFIYEFKDTLSFPAGKHIGLSAQEVQQYFPELIFTDKEGYLSLDYARLSVVLLKAVKEQQAQIEKEKTRNDDLEKQIMIINLKLDQLMTKKAGE